MVQDTPSRKLDQYIVRFPDGMRDQLKQAAARNNRSLNAEIVERLEKSFDQQIPRNVSNALTFSVFLANQFDALVGFRKGAKDSAGEALTRITGGNMDFEQVVAMAERLKDQSDKAAKGGLSAEVSRLENIVHAAVLEAGDEIRQRYIDEHPKPEFSIQAVYSWLRSLIDSVPLHRREKASKVIDEATWEIAKAIPSNYIGPLSAPHPMVNERPAAATSAVQPKSMPHAPPAEPADGDKPKGGRKVRLDDK